MTNELDNNTTLQAYDAVAPVYAEYSEARQKYLQSIESLVISNLRPDMRLLDIGGGDGRRTVKITSEVGIEDFSIVEPSSEMARICHQRTGKDIHKVFAEEIHTLDIGKFDAVTALWNVFGHIPNNNKRLQALQCIADKMNSDAIVILDVNNRHNASAYGALNVFKRKVVDTLFFDETRGDAVYDWKIRDQVFKSSGHLFVPEEIEALIRKAGMKVLKCLAVDYSTGYVSSSKYKGQLFYTLEKI